MAIVVTPTYYGRFKDISEVHPRRAKLGVTGLVVGANVIPHGLGGVPQIVGLNAGAAGGWGQTQPADATNIYVTVGAAGALAGTINVQL